MNTFLADSFGLQTIVDAPVWVLLLLKLTAILSAAWLAHLAIARLNPRWRVFLWRMTAVGRRFSALKKRVFHQPLRRWSVLAFGLATILGMAALGAMQFALAAPPPTEPAIATVADKTEIMSERKAATPAKTKTVRDRYETANQLVAMLRDKRFDDAVACFDADLRKILPASKLETLWTQLADSYGPFFDEYLPREEYKQFGATEFVSFRSRWQKTSLDIRFAFDRQDRVCGLWVDAEEGQPPAGFPKEGYQFGTVVETAAKASLSLEAKIFGLDGKPVKKSHIKFWMAVDYKAEQDARCWHDSATDKVWRYISGASVGSSRTARFLVPGLYRITARQGHQSGPPIGLSDPITLDGSQKHTVVEVWMAAGSTLTLRPVDADTGEPAPRPAVRVTCKSDNLPPRWRFSPSGSEPVLKIENMPPGVYSIDATLRAGRPDAIEHRLEGGLLEVKVVAGKDSEVALPMRAARLTEDEIAKRWSWIVVGRVTDEQGQGVGGVTVRANCGLGTCFTTGITDTDKNGRYTLRFAPGMHTFSRKPGEVPVNQQAALISASQPGFTEKNLHRQGGLSMANRQPPSDYPIKSTRQLVLPHRPVTVDFVLVPAASLDGELLDAEGKPIAEKHLWIDGKELPPGCSVLRSGKTDGRGRFSFKDIPLGYAWWIRSDRVMRRDIRTPPLTFSHPMQYKVRLQLGCDASSGLDLLKVLSVQDTEGKEVGNEVVGDDPIVRPPLPPELQAKGRGILGKMAEVNRYWLNRPPPEVRGYRYDFKLGEKEPKTYVVPEDGRVAGVVRRGISYVSVLYGLTTHAESVVFRQIDIAPDKMTLTFTLPSGASVSAGNGVLGTWSGFFSTTVSEGTMIVDPKTYALREFRCEEHRETLSDYTEIRPGHFVPLRVHVSSDGMAFDFRFRLYEPGLWLFASSHREGSPPAAQVDNVIVNGEPGKISSLHSSGNRS